MRETTTMFSKKEVANLTGLTRSQVQYLHVTGMVKCQKLDLAVTNSNLVFSWNALLECRAIANLRSLGVTLQNLRKAKNYLLDRDPDANLASYTFVLMGKELLLVESSEVATKLLVQVTGRNVGQFILLPVADLQNELDEQAKILNIENWTKRRNTKLVQQYVVA